MHAKSKKKIFLLVAVILLVVGIVAYFGVGNYFFNYALVRPVISEEDDRAPKNTQSEETRKNQEDENARVDEWLKEASSESREITSHDGISLKSTIYKAPVESNRWVIAVHGYKSSAKSMRPFAMNYNQKGYHVLTPDLRSHGESDGKYIGMGWLDKEDVVQWIHLLVEENPEAEIILHGVSMGGATVMMTAGEDLPSNVKAIIEDCGYTSVYQMFVAQLDYRFGLPEFPIINAARTVAKLRAGYDIKEASSLEQLRNAKVPMLFIHGSEDTYVPTEMVYEVYDMAPVEKDMVIIEGAEHANSDIVNPAAYYGSIWEFLKKWDLL